MKNSQPSLTPYLFTRRAPLQVCYEERKLGRIQDFVKGGHFGKYQPKSELFHEKPCHFKEIGLSSPTPLDLPVERALDGWILHMSHKKVFKGVWKGKDGPVYLQLQWTFYLKYSKGIFRVYSCPSRGWFHHERKRIWDEIKFVFENTLPFFVICVEIFHSWSIFLRSVGNRLWMFCVECISIFEKWRRRL